MEMQWKLFVCFGFFSLSNGRWFCFFFFSSVFFRQFFFIFIFIFCRNRNGWKCIVFISHRQFMANPLSVCSAMAMMCFETIWALNKYNIMWVRFFFILLLFAHSGCFFFTFCYWSFRTSGINNTLICCIERKCMHINFNPFCAGCVLSRINFASEKRMSQVFLWRGWERRRRENKRNACPCPCPYIWCWCFISLSLAI